MAKKILPVLYISGPMTGCENYNFDLFDEVARKLRILGFPVLNPADFGAHPADKWEECLVRDVSMLAHADVMILLPGWQESRGSKLEVGFHVGLCRPTVEWNDALAFNEFLRTHLTLEEMAGSIRESRLRDLRRMALDNGEHCLFDFSGHDLSDRDNRAWRNDAYNEAIGEIHSAYQDYFDPATTVRMNYERAAEGPLTFSGFAATNRRRREDRTGWNQELTSWSLSQWMVGVAYTLDDAANIAEKLTRIRDGKPGNTQTDAELVDSLRDAIAETTIYLDLVAQSQGFDLGKSIKRKFNQTSDKIGCSIKC